MRRPLAFVEHSVAGGLALLFAWHVSGTASFNTGLQFVAPLAIVLLAHLLWIGLWRGYAPGYARIALSRMLTTSIAIAGLAILAALVAPMPSAAADTGPVLGVILVSLACLAVLAGVIFVAALVVYFVAINIVKAVRALRERDRDSASPGRDDDKHYDAGVVAMAFLIIVAASLEGIAPGLSFPANDVASSTVAVAAPPESVWRQVGKATSPEFPLPAMLKIIPRPVAVLVDEGAGLGARRIVHFVGREGEGDLVLRVVRRTGAETEFAAVSDTTPVAMWVRQQALTFRVEPSGSGSTLTVSLRYDRLLAPAWFFRPFTRAVAELAVDVLARDTRDRAEPR
jgi:hypothetical protein